MSAETLIDSIITAAQDTALTMQNKAVSYADDAQTAALSVVDLGALPTAAPPTRVVTNFLPDADVEADKFRVAYAELANDLSTKFVLTYDAFKQKYFPLIDTDLQTSVDGWIKSTITDAVVNGKILTGIPVDVENQIWERSRERELRDFYRTEDELISGWARRGFSLPGGALLDAQQHAQKALSEKISTHSRDVAIKQVEIHIETIKFAVKEGIDLRIRGLEAADKFTNAWFSINKSAIAYADGILQARHQLWSVLAAYYDALIRQERLLYDWGKDRAALSVEQTKSFVQLVNNNTTTRVNAAISAADAVARIGAAALAAQNSLVHISNDTINQG